MLSVSGLRITLSTEDGPVDAVKGVTFDVAAGEILAVVGESGSGKSLTSLSVLGLVPPNGQVGGAVRLDDRELSSLSPKELRRIRGNDVAMIFQDPASALNPVHTVGWQIREAVRAHRDLTRSAADARVLDLLGLVGVPDAARRVKQYPHQLSGGLRQRVVIAMAIACDPKVIIADEPTSALDVTVQAEILDLLRTLRDAMDTAIVLVTHDMGVVSALADRVAVMRSGELVEQAPVRQLFDSPRHAYTRELLAATPRLGDRDEAPRPPGDPVLEIRNLVFDYPGKRGERAVDDVSFTIGTGEVLGMVGESGSGKSTIGRCAIRLLKPSSGTVSVLGEDITTLSVKKLRPLRRAFSIVFQDPVSSLDPRLTVADSIAEPLVLHRESTVDSRVSELLDQVQLGRGHRNRYPHELSGGQCQRVAIARALALSPRLLIADEPTSALDVSVQAKILDLFAGLQRDLGFACLFISHDFAVVDALADRVAVLRAGKIVETGTRQEVLRAPKDPYTRQLLSAVL
ncbi:ABC transporter ATP-binding protein [Amycolatopsis sp. CA-230715]|uniref:ABC transporter ATP-binding protein n=1 Tax=Amycolatopsis sp. CA-230715 TaxID=2745196 RepID=UPI001C00C27F|nr:ABC transporter ATP-binding protein [Amycolatopsis sp. CA-230715]